MANSTDQRGSETKKKLWLWPWSRGKAAEKSGSSGPRKFHLPGGTFGRSVMAPQVPALPADPERPSNVGLGLGASARRKPRPASLELAPATPETFARLQGVEVEGGRGGRGGGRRISQATSHPALRRAAEAQGVGSQGGRPSPATPSLRTPPVSRQMAEAMEEWQSMPNTPSPLTDIGGHRRPRRRPVSDAVQSLRTICGLTPLQERGDSDRKHPNHNYMWNTQNVMCRGIHNQAAGTATGKHPRECSVCHEPCCKYVSIQRTANIESRDKILALQVNKARLQVESILDFAPDGVEDYQILMQCANCDQPFCPECGGRCSQLLCAALLCKKCLENDNKCSIH